ncbi:hypothetical protein [Sorangium sp. So ce1151]|uniref:hypothetical protein n=1 Tax=Sorangium sp. So ce1151 TaxID=3133332 RepID=UPI003F5E69BC
MRTEISLNDWLLFLVEDRLQTLTSFGQDLERMSAAELKRFQDSIEESAKKIADEGERQDFFEWHLDTLVKYQEEYPQVGRELILVKANFILEAELMELARWLERKKSIPSLAKFKKGRPSSSQIGYAADYLETNGVALARGATWNDIEAIRIMRNAIVHSDGQMDSTDFGSVAASRLATVADLKNDRLHLHSPLHDAVVHPIMELFRSIDRSLYPDP